MFRFLAGLAFLQASFAAINLHIVPHTHDDVGWLKTVDEYFSGRNNSIQHANVRSILTSAVQALTKSTERKFTYVEQAFFQRWWREQDDETKDLTRALVKSGQLNFVNGGWCMHDEAATHFVAMIDQTTLGHRLLKEQFGDDGIVTVGWQLDPFGHSASQAALLSAEVGFDALFFGRIDYQDLAKRLQEQRAEFIWRASPSLGQDAQVFAGLTGEYGGNYGPPDGFNWDVFSDDEPIEDNAALTTYNVQSRINDAVAQAVRQANRTRGQHIMWTMGSDFHYEAAESWFRQLDKLIQYLNADGRVNAFYSSPAEYAQAKYAEATSGAVTWPLDTGDNSDFMPYADGPHQFWTGYFTSRPSLKRYVYEQSAYFNAVRGLQSLTRKSASPLADVQRFEEALGVAQHHDAVSGTAKQHVAFDYAQRISNGHAVVAPVKSDALNALLGTTGLWTECLRRNETVCAQSQQRGAAITVNVWNPIGQARTHTIRLPVSSTSVSVTTATGAPVAVQVSPAGETVSEYARNTNEALYMASFQASLPALGSASFVLSSSTGENARTTASRPMGGGADVTIENDYLKLTFDQGTGRVKGMLNKVTGTSTSLNQTFCYYESSEGDGDSGQRSGAYIFRPKKGTACVEVAGAAKLEAVEVVGDAGDIVQEVRQTFAPWLTQTVRLLQGARHAEFEYTVGPIDLRDPRYNPSDMTCVSWRQTGNCNPDGPREPQNDKPCSATIAEGASGYCECANGRQANKENCNHELFTCAEACLYVEGKEVVSRFTTNIASKGEILTDSNGREMLRRQRNYRPTWSLQQTEPVAGNYFPCTAAAAIRDSQAQLTILVDRSQAVGSITDGTMEFMVHRRVLKDDSRGVGEPLDETQFTRPYTGGNSQGQHFGNGLIIRGVHHLTLEPPASAAAVWRPLADRVFASPLISFNSRQPVKDVAAIAKALPPNVQLVTLAALSPRSVLLRLAHQFGLGEDTTLSAPATVDLAALFAPNFLSIKSVQEVSLTNSQTKAQLVERRHANSKWHTLDGAVPHPWRTSFNSSAAAVTIGPLEIKTFVLGL